MMLNERLLKKKIINELQSIGYNLSHVGTRYLIDIILLTNKDDDFLENLKKNTYPILSKKYNKSVNSIKSNISRATESMYYACREEKLKEYFKLYHAEKPKSKLIISTVLNNI